MSQDSASQRRIDISKALSFALRHATPEKGVNIRSDGFVPISEVLMFLNRKFASPVTKMEIESVVTGCQKQRFGSNSTFHPHILWL